VARASRLGAAILEQIGHPPRFFVSGVEGTFDVQVNGELIFSRDIAGRSPSAREIVAMINDRGL